MRLTGFTDYTLRTLMYLALQPDRLVTIADIADAYNISANHLMKVVHQLSVAGDIVTTRGRHGGLRLARPPSDINIGAVVRRTEPDMALVACFESDHNCPIDSCCVLQRVMRDALAAFVAVLDRYTLADLVAPRLALAELLGLPSPT